MPPDLQSAGVVTIADADPHYRRHLGERLQEAGFTVREAADGLRLLAEVGRETPSLVILDLQLPSLGGLELCGRLKRVADLPLLVLTAQADEETKVRALELYADDYVLKSANHREITARVRCLLRRWQLVCPTARADVRIDERLSLNFLCREARTPFGPAHLTQTEMRLLRLLLNNAGHTLPSSFLLERLWGDSSASPANLWEYVRRLRRKLGDDTSHPHYILCEPGLGYSFAKLEADRGSSRGGDMA